MVQGLGKRRREGERGGNALRVLDQCSGSSGAVVESCKPLLSQITSPIVSLLSLTHYFQRPTNAAPRPICIPSITPTPQWPPKSSPNPQTPGRPRSSSGGAPSLQAPPSPDEIGTIPSISAPGRHRTTKLGGNRTLGRHVDDFQREAQQKKQLRAGAMAASQQLPTSFSAAASQQLSSGFPAAASQHLPGGFSEAAFQQLPPLVGGAGGPGVGGMMPPMQGVVGAPLMGGGAAMGGNPMMGGVPMGGVPMGGGPMGGVPLGLPTMSGPLPMSGGQLGLPMHPHQVAPPMPPPQAPPMQQQPQQQHMQFAQHPPLQQQQPSQNAWPNQQQQVQRQQQQQHRQQRQQLQRPHRRERQQQQQQWGSTPFAAASSGLSSVPGDDADALLANLGDDSPQYEGLPGVAGGAYGGAGDAGVNGSGGDYGDYDDDVGGAAQPLLGSGSGLLRRRASVMGEEEEDVYAGLYNPSEAGGIDELGPP